MHAHLQRLIKTASLLAFFTWMLVPCLHADKPKSKKPRGLQIEDIAQWKSIRSVKVSNDGKWLSILVTPNDGDAELVVRESQGKTVHRFPVGASAGSAGQFSEDSQWLAFSITPTQKQKETLKKSKKPERNNLALLELATGEKTDISEVQSFRFSGDAADCIALKKYAPESAKSTKAKGGDLILRELKSGEILSFGNVASFAFNKAGDWLAMIIDANGQAGNGVQLFHVPTKRIRSIETDKASYSNMNWSKERDALALLKSVKDKTYKNDRVSVIAFRCFTPGKAPVKVVFDPTQDKNAPKDMTVSPNRTPRWSDDCSLLSFGIHKLDKVKAEPKPAEENKKKPAPKKSETSKDKKKDGKPADLVIWHWQDKRLQSQQQKQASRDKNFSYLCVYHVASKKFVRLADDKVRDVSLAPNQRWAIGTDDQSYRLMSSLDGRRYRDVYVIDIKTGQRKLVLKKSRWYFGPSPDGTHLLYFDKGHYHTCELLTCAKMNITQDVPTSFVNTEDDHNVIDRPLSPIGWTKGGGSILLYDNWDIWRVDRHGDTGVNLTVNGKEEGIRYRRRLRLDSDEKGIDLSEPIYISAQHEWTKESGIFCIENGSPGVKQLLWGKCSFTGLQKAKNADVMVYQRHSNLNSPNVFVANPDFAKPERLTDVNPQQKDYLWSSGVRLIDYKNSDGDKLKAALFLPANYSSRETYPTILYMYEKLSQRAYSYQRPTVRGFNASIYTSNGYAVLMPDIKYKINDPGRSSVDCLTAALNAGIKTGVIDPKRVGIHGHSWGGYQTAFMITQSKAFKAAVAGAPLTNLISMYSSIYWNTGSTNQPIFESSQGRFNAPYWKIPEAYTRNSPVYYAHKVTTPLLLLHNDKDGAVDWNQGIEYFNTLRRLRKPVVMLQYKGENHGLVKNENRRDYTVRMQEFFDHYLKGKPAPQWLKEGIPHLKHGEHLKERAKAEVLNP